MKRVIITSIFALVFVLIGAGSMSAQNASVAGEWDASMNTPGGARAMKFVFTVDGEKVSGTVKRSNGDVPLKGTIKGDVILFDYTVNYNGNDLTLSFSGKVTGDSMGGTVSFAGQAEDSWSATRKPAEKPKMN